MTSVQSVAKIGLLSDFNLANFAAYLDNNNDPPVVASITAPFGQVVTTLMQPDADFWKSAPDAVIVWTLVENVIPSFNALLSSGKVSTETLLTEVDQFCDWLSNIPSQVKTILIPIWTLAPHFRGFGLLEEDKGLGLAGILMRMNIRLVDRIKGEPRAYLLDAQRWITNAGEQAYNSRLWYLSKNPFHNQVFKEAAREVKALLRALAGSTKKLILLDLDGTLWDGIAGEDGWRNLRLGGHDAIGEAYVDFQRALKTLAARGILLGIVSKNEESVALEAIRSHPEMVLSLEDFCGWRINWNDKAQNVLDLVLELNLGIDSVVFIDDSPAERARVREALPEVLVPEWPEHPMFYKSALLALNCFDAPFVSAEDRSRTAMYGAERKRQELRRQIESFEDWLKTLQLRVKVEELNEANLQRAVQLLNKTNQMNLSTRKMTEEELLAWTKCRENKLWTFRVSDKFGDSGLTGIASLTLENGRGKIQDFILSCRVMGRRIEEAMLAKLMKEAKEAGASELYAEYIPTPKNPPCLKFFQQFSKEKENQIFNWKLDHSPKIPDGLELIE